MKQPGRPVQKATISSNKAALVETIIVLEGTLKGTLAAKEAGILVLHVVYSMCVVSPPPITTTPVLLMIPKSCKHASYAGSAPTLPPLSGGRIVSAPLRQQHRSCH
jgi:hypothetical protein